MGIEDLPIDRIIQGDCIDVLESLPDQSVDLIFADPPYFLQLQKSQELWRPNQTKVNGVDDDWDQFRDWEEYDRFSKEWLKACRRVLKEEGTIWVIGTYHNIYRLGAQLQDLGFWILNDLVWIKTNPMPNFRGVRFTNAHETLLWACKTKGAKYTFNYHAMKNINEGVQMRSDWWLPLCTGKERIRVNGKKAHSTQKPEALLYRIILSSSDPGNVILDPFFGTGTTGVVSKKLHRHWIGIEKNSQYISIAADRIRRTPTEPYDPANLDVRDIKRRQARIPFSSLIEHGLLRPGECLYFRGDKSNLAKILPDGRLAVDGTRGSIHQIGKRFTNGGPYNGWDYWYFEAEDGKLNPIDELREQLRSDLNQ